MGSATWQDKTLKAAEEKVTRVVDRILSRNYWGRDRGVARVQEVLASLEMPGREETDALKEEVHSLRNQLKELSARLEDLSRPCDQDAKAG